jgi:hypothetical protein
MDGLCLLSEGARGRHECSNVQQADTSLARFRGPTARVPLEQSNPTDRRRTTVAIEIWTYRERFTDLDLTDFKVEALDGEIGKVDDATYETGTSTIIVDTGPWILGKKAMLPAGTIERIDPDERTIYVDRTKDEIKAAPEYDPSGYAEQEYRLRLGDYYSGLYS